MNKKNIKFLIFGGLLLQSMTIHAQFYTLRNTPKKFVVVQDSTKKESRTIKEVDKSQELEHFEEDSIDNNTDRKVSFFRKVFSLPTKKLRINSKYGYRNDPFLSKKKFHAGVDLASSKQEVCSIMPGTITKIGFDKKGLGNYVSVLFSDFLITYAHLKSSIGTEGDVVKAGDVVGISGSTGRSTGDHLHLSIKYRGKYVDPLPILRFIQEEEKSRVKDTEAVTKM